MRRFHFIFNRKFVCRSQLQVTSREEATEANKRRALGLAAIKTKEQT